jgi:hypothetical protein
MITTKSQSATIIKYLQESLGIKAPEGATREELFELVRTNGGKIEDSSDEPSKTSTNKESDIDALCKTKVRIKLFEKAGADRQLTVGINGVHTTIQRGVEVTVPYPIYDLLKNSITIEYEQKGDEVTQREVQTDPFTVIKFDVQPGDFKDAE